MASDRCIPVGQGRAARTVNSGDANSTRRRPVAVNNAA